MLNGEIRVSRKLRQRRGRRFVAGSLVAGLCLGGVAACSSSGSGTNTGDTTPASTTTSASSAETTSAAPETASTSPTTGTPTKISMVLPTTGIISEYPLWVALKLGYYAEEGLDVTINPVKGGDLATTTLAAGKADLTHLPIQGVLLAASKQAGFHPVFICEAVHGDPFGVYVPSDSGIKSAADLKGKTIGVESLTTPAADYTRNVEAGVGLADKTDYKLLPVGAAGEALAALQRGDIQAYGGGVGDAAIILAKGYKLTQLDPGPSLLADGGGFWTTQKFLDAHPDALKAFLRAEVKAVNYIGKDADKLVDFAATVQPSQVADRAVAIADAEAFIALRGGTNTVKGCAVTQDQIDGWWKAATGGASGDPTQYFNNDIANQ